MKKTMLLSVVPLMLFVIGCSKSDTNSNCTFEQLFSEGKIYRPSYWVHYRNTINIDQKYYSKTDSIITTYQFNGNGTGVVRFKYSLAQWSIDSMRWLYVYKDTSVALTYSVNTTEKKMQTSFYNPGTQSVISTVLAVDSFTCKTFRTREVETNGTKIDEYYMTYIND